MTMPPIHMEPHEWQQVAAILDRHLPGRAVWAFGSRSTGQHLKRFSDLDLAVQGELTWPERATLSEAFDESLLPFKVDLVELNRIDPAFRARITPNLVPLRTVPTPQPAPEIK